MENQLSELKNFLREYNISLDSEQIDDKRKRCTITFRIQNLESYFVNNQNPSEIVFGKGVEIRMIFSLSSSLVKPRLQVIGENQPFHPHFSTNNNIIEKFSKAVFTSRFTTNDAEWVDYRLQQTPEDIVSFLTRVILSLQYHKDCIDITTIQRIANLKAREWYLIKYQRDSKQFPIGNLFRKKFVPNEINQNFTNRESNDSQEQISNAEKRFEAKAKKKFEVNQQVGNESGTKKFEVKSSYTKKKFKIIKETLGYVPLEKVYIEEPTDQALNSIISNETDLKVKILLTEEAQEQIRKHISWGERTKNNIVEQGGILLGHVYNDIDRKVQFAVVEKAIAGNSAKGSSAYLEMGHEVWREMVEMADKYLDANPEYNIQIIGWYHTHPNSLDVFMSGTDRNTQSLYFYKDWHYAIVLNPHKKIWKAFYGKNAYECEGIFLNNPTPPSILHRDKNVDATTNKEEELLSPPDENPPRTIAESLNSPLIEQKKTENSPTILLIIILIIIIAAVGTIFFTNMYRDKKNGERNEIVQPVSFAPHSNSDSINKEADEKKAGEEMAKTIFNIGDKIKVRKDLIIFSPLDTTKSIASCQNEFEIIVSAVNSNFLIFEQKLYVGEYHINRDLSLIKLNDNAKLKIMKIPRGDDKENQYIFAISKNDTSTYIVKEDTLGWFEINYVGCINANDINGKQ